MLRGAEAARPCDLRAAGYDPKTDIRYIWSFEFNIIGCNAWTDDDLRELLRRVADGRMKPVVHCQRPLSEIRIPFGN